LKPKRQKILNIFVAYKHFKEDITTEFSMVANGIIIWMGHSSLFIFMLHLDAVIVMTEIFLIRPRLDFFRKIGLAFSFFLEIVELIFPKIQISLLLFPLR
jgi:hypothetical protein